MPKDYGKKTPNKSSSKGLKSLLRIVVSFSCGYLLATICDFATVKDWISQNWPGKAEGLATANKVIKSNELPKPKFEFYTLLTKSANTPSPMATVPVETAAPLRVQQPIPMENQPQKISSKGAYVVQIAAFKSRQEAERLKASLILKGLDANISIAMQQETSWFRVSMGPFNTRGEAEKAQLALTKTEHVKSMIRKIG